MIGVVTIHTSSFNCESGECLILKTFLGSDCGAFREGVNRWWRCWGCKSFYLLRKLMKVDKELNKYLIFNFHAMKRQVFLWWLLMAMKIVEIKLNFMSWHRKSWIWRFLIVMLWKFINLLLHIIFLIVTKLMKNVFKSEIWKSISIVSDGFQIWFSLL